MENLTIVRSFFMNQIINAFNLDTAEQYQASMIKHFRNVNVDHHQVGWYQSNPYGSGQGRIETVDTQYMYQSQLEESIFLLLDPIRTQRGFLSLKAFRLTELAMKLCKESEFTPETLRSNKMSFDRFFEEIPIKIRNSQLISGLMCELDEELPIDEGKQFLDLGSFGTLEKSVQSLMKCVEDVSKSANWQRQFVMRQQQIAKENGIRALKNEPLLTDDEMNKILKPPTPLQRLETLLNNCQTLNFCNQASTYSSQNIGKLFMSKALQTSPQK